MEMENNINNKLASSEDVSKYYDETWSSIQRMTLGRPNIRHRSILKKLVSLGLNSNSSVLEIGCGLGSLSRLIIPRVSSGRFLGVDISPKTIEFIKNIFKSNKGVSFLVSNMSDFSIDSKFDFILFPDVLEHIPKEQHFNIFERIATVMHDETVILVNNPEPLCLEWYIQNKPELLQIIDQPLHIDHFSNVCYPVGLAIESVEPYSIHNTVLDYQFIVIKKKRIPKNVSSKTGLSALWQRLKARI